MDDAISTFASMRPQLERIAFRILRSQVQAQAVVDSIAVRFRWQSAILDAPADSRTWLIEATSRLAIERWTTDEARRGAPGEAHALSTRRIATLMDDILAATVAALERLEPDARLAFLLHDIFDADLPELALTLDRPEPECRDLLDRARRELHRPHPRDTP